MASTTNEQPRVRSLTVTLVGNPNTGKSTIFNALAGLRQRVGNYPGVTVEKKTGELTHDGVRLQLVDLPGTYSLSPRSPDEMVAVDVLLGRRDDTSRPDVVLAIVDASNLERNLYLVSQVLELGLPTVLALNMADVARTRGTQIDVERLGQKLGVPVVEMQANRGAGIDALKSTLATAAEQVSPNRESPFPEIFCQEVAALETTLNKEPASEPIPRYLVERLLLDTSGYLEDSLVAGKADLTQSLTAARGRLAEAGSPVPAVEAIARYGWAGRVLDGVVAHAATRPITLSDRIDRILTHRLLGTAVFAVLMFLVFTAVFRWAEPLMGAIDGATGWAAELVDGALADGAFKSLLVDGVIAGVGGVIIFLPQIFILFFFMAVLEDCGYMSRAAYLMDRLMSKVGLSGKSFIPLLSSFACAIPGVMAARVIENRRDRLVTILVAPLMSCSARLPVYTLLIAAFIPEHYYAGGWVGLQSLTMFAMYLIGIVTAVLVALALKRTILKGETPPFVMELPSYKLPSGRTVVYRMCDRGWAFVRRAGTLILAVSIVVWAALYYPRSAEVAAPYESDKAELEAQLAATDEGDTAARDALGAELSAIDDKIAGAYQRQSYLGRVGQFIEPAVKPLGWDWRIGSAAVASFPAREVVVATMGVIFNLGEVDIDETEDASRMHSALRNARWEGTDTKLFNTPVALSLMVFFALCAQCAATLVVIKRETNNWRWPLFTFAYMTLLAYFAAMATYQIGIRITAG